MRCPFCGHDASQVKDSRPTDDGAAIRRRRQCEGCAARFTTFERIQLRELTVMKSEDRREPFEPKNRLRVCYAFRPQLEHRGAGVERRLRESQHVEAAQCQAR